MFRPWFSIPEAASPMLWLLLLLCLPELVLLLDCGGHCWATWGRGEEEPLMLVRRGLLEITAASG